MAGTQMDYSHRDLHLNFVNGRLMSYKEAV